MLYLLRFKCVNAAFHLKSRADIIFIAPLVPGTLAKRATEILKVRYLRACAMLSATFISSAHIYLRIVYSLLTLPTRCAEDGNSGRYGSIPSVATCCQQEIHATLLAREAHNIQIEANKALAAALAAVDREVDGSDELVRFWFLA